MTDRYEPQPKDRVKWLRSGSNSYNKWAKGIVDYIEGDEVVVKNDTACGRTSLRSRYRKHIDQLILVERPGELTDDLPPL